MKKIILLLGFLFFNISIAQAPPPGISFFPYVDGNNDTYELFDIDYYTNIYLKNIAQQIANVNLSGYSIKLYPSILDRSNSSNVIGSLHTNITPTFQSVFIKCTYIGPGTVYPEATLLNLLNQSGLIVLPRLSDYDNDGILNYQEDTNGNLNLLDDNDDGDLIPNYADPGNVLASQTILKNKYEIYPNPTNNIINIGFDSDSIKNGTIIIFDNLGKIVLETKLTNKIDVSQLENGIYLMKITSDKAVSTQKIAIN